MLFLNHSCIFQLSAHDVPKEFCTNRPQLVDDFEILLCKDHKNKKNILNLLEKILLHPETL